MLPYKQVLKAVLKDIEIPFASGENCVARGDEIEVTREDASDWAQLNKTGQAFLAVPTVSPKARAQQ